MARTDMDSMLQFPSEPPAVGNAGPVGRVAGLALFIVGVRVIKQTTSKCDQSVSTWIE